LVLKGKNLEKRIWAVRRRMETQLETEINQRLIEG